MKSTMKKSIVFLIFVVLTVFSLAVIPVFGQSDNSQNNQVENVELNKMLEYILILQKYGPRTLEKEFVRSDFEERVLQGIKDSLTIVSNNMNSSYQTLEYYKDVLSNEALLNGLRFYRLDFGFQPDFYNVLYKFAKVRFNYFFDESLNYLYQVEKVIDDNGDILIAAFGSEMINPLFYRTEYLIGSILMYKGMDMYNKEARNRFEYLLGKNRFKTDFIPTQEERVDIYYKMMDIFDRLLFYNYNIHTDYHKMIVYNREKLSYLWKIVDVNHSNQKIKDVKFRRLYTTYAPIMDPDSENYKNLYSKYRQDWDTLPRLEEEKPTATEENQNLIPTQDNLDTTAPDSGTPDAAAPDSGTPGAAAPDSGTPDAATPDSQDGGNIDNNTGGQ